MSARYHTAMDWTDNMDWFAIDEKRDRYVLTDKAPEEAKESFELYKRINNLNWNDSPISIDDTARITDGPIKGIRVVISDI